ncbi:TPA_asm: hypothetical protein [Variola virus]|nr:TPA_asm: hypothetical protein [Variola virus]
MPSIISMMVRSRLDTYGCYNFYTYTYKKGLCVMSYGCPILNTINICLPYLKDINMIDKRGQQ